jgi:hypothetical protein
LEFDVDEPNVGIVEESEDVILVRYVLLMNDGPVY